MAKQEPITNQQMKAGHLWFRHLAEDLNAAGLDMQKTLKPGIEIWWTDYMIKEYLFRPLMIAMTGKEHTALLTREEFDKINETIIRVIGEKHGLVVPFPSLEALMDEERLKQIDKEQDVRKKEQQGSDMGQEKNS